MEQHDGRVRNGYLVLYREIPEFYVSTGETEFDEDLNSELAELLNDLSGTGVVIVGGLVADGSEDDLAVHFDPRRTLVIPGRVPHAVQS
jgi:hypothetical protein